MAALPARAEDRVGACLASVDDAFADLRAAPDDTRWGALRELAVAESTCLNALVTDCAHQRDIGGCFARIGGVLATERVAVMARMPAPEDVPGRLADPYVRWHDTLERGAARVDQGVGRCPLPDPLRTDGCPAMAEADLLLRARDWDRVLTLVEDVQ